MGRDAARHHGRDGHGSTPSASCTSAPSPATMTGTLILIGIDLSHGGAAGDGTAGRARGAAGRGGRGGTAGAAAARAAQARGRHPARRRGAGPAWRPSSRRWRPGDPSLGVIAVLRARHGTADLRHAPCRHPRHDDAGRHHGAARPCARQPARPAARRSAPGAGSGCSSGCSGAPPPARSCRSGTPGSALAGTAALIFGAGGRCCGVARTAAFRALSARFHAARHATDMRLPLLWSSWTL